MLKSEIKEKTSLPILQRKLHCKIMYVNKLDNLDDTNKFLQRHKLPNWTQKEIEILYMFPTNRISTQHIVLIIEVKENLLTIH